MKFSGNDNGSPNSAIAASPTKALFRHKSHNYLLICLGFLGVFFSLLASAQDNTEQPWITAYSEPYAGYAEKMDYMPKETLEEVVANPPNESASNVDKAQYHAILSQLYFSLSYGQKALDQALLGISLVKDINEPWLLHRLFLYESMAYQVLGKDIDAFDGINKAVLWAEQNADIETLVLGLFLRAASNMDLSDYSEALADVQKATLLVDDNTPGKVTPMALVTLQAQIYLSRDEEELAIPLYEQAAESYRKEGDLSSLNIILYSLGLANSRINNYEQAIFHLNQTLEITEKIDNLQGTAYALNLLAKINTTLGNYEQAEQQLMKAKALFGDEANNSSKFNTALNLASLAFKQDDPQKVRYYLEEAQKYLDRETMLPAVFEFDELRAELLFKDGNAPQAYHLIKSVYEAFDKYTENKSTEQFHKLRSLYDLKNTKQKNQVLENRNKIQELELKDQKNNNLFLALITGFAIVFCFFLMLAIYKSKNHRIKLEKLARTDGLTGLYNRRYVLESLEQQIALAKRHQFALSVVMMDLDWFKKINDTFGHSVGDDVLVGFSEVCKKRFRETDVIGRVGGEEFLVLLINSTAENTFKIIETIRKKMPELTKQFDLPGLNISVSAGISEYRQKDTPEKIILLADNALYQAKNGGRNQVVINERQLKTQTLAS